MQETEKEALKFKENESLTSFKQGKRGRTDGFTGNYRDKVAELGGVD